MNLYLICFRLNLTLFVLSNLGGIWIYMKTHNFFLALITIIVILPLTFFIMQPFVKRYNYFFLNKGWNPAKLYLVTVLMDLLFFFSFIVLLNFVA